MEKKENRLLHDVTYAVKHDIFSFSTKSGGCTNIFNMG